MFTKKPLRSSATSWRWVMMAFAVFCPQLALANLQVVDFTNKGTFSTPQFSIDGVTITGSSQILFLNLNGIGIVGGASDTTLDPGEAMTFTFQTPTTFIDLRVSAFGNLQGVQFNQVRVHATGANHQDLGTVTSFEPVSNHNLNSIFGGQAISAFTLETNANQYRFGSLAFDVTPIPEPSSLTLLLLGLTPLLLRKALTRETGQSHNYSYRR